MHRDAACQDVARNHDAGDVAARLPDHRRRPDDLCAAVQRLDAPGLVAPGGHLLREALGGGARVTLRGGGRRNFHDRFHDRPLTVFAGRHHTIDVDDPDPLRGSLRS